MSAIPPFNWTVQPLYVVKSVVILDLHGKRVLAKYYDKSTFESTEKEHAFEAGLFEKIRRSSSEILIFDNNLVVHRSVGDVMIVVVGNVEENEIMLMDILSTYVESLNSLFRNLVDKKTLLENLDYALLALDELVDGGIPLEAEAEAIASRVHLRSADVEEQSVLSDALKLARDQIAKTLLA